MSRLQRYVIGQPILILILLLQIVLLDSAVPGVLPDRLLIGQDTDSGAVILEIKH